MIFERFEVKGLSHYSYLVGCERSREVAVVDPQRDVDIYLNYAREKNLKITTVTETHIHADYASGAKELAEASGAKLALSAYDKGEIYDVRYAHRELSEGDTIEVGSIKLKVLHTPGHTPEHISFLVFDPERSTSEPDSILSGDFLFVGSVGRPDLLGEDSKEGLAHQMYQSIKKLESLPEQIKIFPAHGAGSMCGAGMGKTPSSTLQAERLSNPYLHRGLEENEFVKKLLSNVPPLPAYYPRMKKLNADGPPNLETILNLKALSLAEFETSLIAGAQVIDLRDQPSFGAGHIPGAFGIGAGSSFVTWAAWVIEPDKGILLLSPSEKVAEEAARALVRVGLDSIVGYLNGGWDTWSKAKKPIVKLPHIEARELAQSLAQDRTMQVLDVRNDSEWVEGHIAGAVHIMGGNLADNLGRFEDKERPIAVTCAGGYRSTVAASVLQRAGYKNVINVSGGMNAWKSAGLPIV